MTNPPTASSRQAKDERLAAKLRENLRRRKTQAREMDASPPADAAPDAGPQITPDIETNPALSKAPPKS